MIRLKTLGSVDLRAAEAVLHGVLRQPKRLGLFAYLAIERPGEFHRRDHLLGMFWPESDLKSGRAALSQAIHFLRQALGRDVILNRGDEEIGLDASLVECDAALFQQHIRAGRFDEALSLYSGELLPGFFVDEAPGFEQWLEQKRSAFQRDAMRAASALADAAAASGNHSDVVRWLRRAINYFPYDESLHRRLINALDQMGDRAAALRAYDDLEQTLAREFEAKPAAETQALMEAVRARSQAQATGVREQFTVSSPASPSLPKRRRTPILMALTVVVIVAGALTWSALAGRETVKEETAPMNRIAVLFFDDLSPQGDLAYLADGLTSTLIDHLGQVRQLEVISQNGVRPFRGDSLPIDSVARHLDVGTVVGGTVSRSGDRFRVTVQITRGATGVVARSRTFERPSGELFSLLDDIAAEVGSFLRSSVGEEMKFERYRSETRSVAAWQHVREAERLIAAANDPSTQGDAAHFRARADSLLVEATRLDAKWTAPYAIRGGLFLERAMVAWFTEGSKRGVALMDSAQTSTDQALARAPRNAAALEERGVIRYIRWAFDGSGELADAEADLRQALQTDPQRGRAESTLSAVYESEGRFEDARRAALRALDADAYLLDSDQIVTRLFSTSFEVGNDAEAGHWCDEARRRMSGKWPSAWCDLVLIGWASNRPDARKALFLVETFGPRDAPPLREAMRPRLMMLAAATLARSGDSKTAERMIADAHALAPADYELLALEAAARILLHQEAQADSLLQEYFRRNPRGTARIAKGRLFRPLRAPQRAALSGNLTGR